MNDPRSRPAQKPKPAPPPQFQASTRFRSLSDPESLREFAKNLREGIYITTPDGRLLDCNPAFLEMVGITAASELGEYGANKLFVNIQQRVDEMLLLDRDGSVREFEISLLRADGETRTVLDTCYIIRDPDTGAEFIHGILIDITARKQLEASLLEASTHDALTGALNRRHLTAIEEQFANDPDLRYGCIFVDVDNFKQYNDTNGHLEGDEALKRMARFLMRYTRVEESVMRVGGDEFVVLLADADDEQTKAVADRLRIEALEHAPVAFSLGFASRERGETLQRLIDRADRGLMEVRVIRRSVSSRASSRDASRLSSLPGD
jgi:diguanylate cyclase (GGDEF)-like protein/PAS domain S-box-containing protein